MTWGRRAGDTWPTAWRRECNWRRSTRRAIAWEWRRAWPLQVPSRRTRRCGKQNALVRAALDGTMLRNDIYNFLRLGTFIERADSTARILDVKYYVLLSSLSQVGSSIDFVQWESILRSVSALRAYRWLHGNQISSKQIANFLILDERMSRSLTFCLQKINNNLFYLSQTYQKEFSCTTLAESMFKRLQHVSIDKILLDGLHEYLITFLSNSEALNKEIETNFGFYG